MGRRRNPSPRGPVDRGTHFFNCPKSPRAPGAKHGLWSYTKNTLLAKNINVSNVGA